MSAGNISPFFGSYGPASATSPGILTNGAQTIGGDKTWNGSTTFVATAVPAAEVVATFKVSDDSVGKLEILNAVSTNSSFAPVVKGTAPGALQPLFLLGAATNDSVSSTNACVKIDGRTAANGALSTKNILEVSNNNTSLGLWGANGAVSITGGTAPGLTVGASGTKITQAKVYSQTLTPSSVAANTTAEQTFTVSGLTTADKVTINPGAAPTAGTGIVGVRVSAADTLAVTYSNNTAGALTPVSSTCLILATRS